MIALEAVFEKDFREREPKKSNAKKESPIKWKQAEKHRTNNGAQHFIPTQTKCAEDFNKKLRPFRPILD